MKRTKLQNMIGLAQRAGKIVSGFDLVIKALHKHSALLLVLASDMSDKQKNKLREASSSLEIIEHLTRDEISEAIGRERSVLVITDRSFATEINRLSKEEQHG